jgi:hypothetical protein
MPLGLEILSLSKNSLRGRKFPSLSVLNRLNLSEEMGKESGNPAGIAGKLVLLVLLIFFVTIN